jgi:release factor glutamine methyltransferase
LTTVGEALAEAATRVDRRDALVLVAHALAVDRAWLVSHDQDALSPEQAQRLQQLLAEREQGVPVAYLTGTREFYGRPFSVNPSVLIPRPETELLVEAAIGRLPHGGRLLDLGTGSCAIAITIACERADAEVTATDLSAEALRLAKPNAKGLGARVRFLEGDWFDCVTNESFDVIVSNPPYVAAGDEHLSRGDLRFEPLGALTDGSEDGLASLRRLIATAPRHLRACGWLLVEHGYDQARACARLFSEAGYVAPIAIADLAGITRIAGGRRANP